MTNINEIASRALKSLTSAGADKALVSVSESEKREFNMEGGEFTLMRTLFDNKLSLTAIVNGRRGVVAVNHLDDESVEKAVSEVMTVAASAEPDDAWDFARQAEPQNITQGAVDPDMDKFFARVSELAADIRAGYPKIMVESLVASHTKTKEAFVNSYGVSHTLSEGQYDVSIMYSGHEGDKAGSFNASGFVTDNLDTPFITRASLKKDFADAENQIHTEPLNGNFTGTVVFPANCFAMMLYGALSNFTGMSTMLDGTCIWKDKLNQKVADERLTISLNPHDASIVCGERYTSEGFVAEDYDIIKDGVLKSFTLNLYAANRTGKPRALNNSWNMVVAPGDTAYDDIIAGIEFGIVAGRFSGGAPGANGDFSGVAKNSFLIEDGKITKPLTETMISGNLATMLNNLRALSRETMNDGSMTLPAAAFDGITISGK